MESFQYRLKRLILFVQPDCMRFLLLWLLMSVTCTGCFRRFVLSEKQLRAWSASQPVKPVYFTIQNDSVSLFCATAGADTLPPLLLIHGAPGAWYGSRAMLTDSALLKHFQVIAVDRPGYNKSKFNGKRKAVTGIETQAVAINEAIRLNHSQRPGIILGNSYGGPIAAKIVIDHPDEFYHLVMLAPSIDPAREKFWWFHPYIRKGPVKWMLPRFMRNATDEKFAHVKELEKILPLWHKIQVPVTVIQGDADRIVDPANLNFARRQLSGGQANFILLHGAGHLIRWQYPGLVSKILLEAAAGVPEKNH
jgi:pimeloyl-ACP methyl ester carboxylesterase